VTVKGAPGRAGKDAAQGVDELVVALLQPDRDREASAVGLAGSHDLLGVGARVRPHDDLIEQPRRLSRASAWRAKLLAPRPELAFPPRSREWTTSPSPRSPPAAGGSRACSGT
jgi:hypothetical protein